MEEGKGRRTGSTEPLFRPFLPFASRVFSEQRSTLDLSAYRSPSFLKTTRTKILGVAVPRIKHEPCKQRHLELASTQVAKTPLRARESEIDFIPFLTLFVLPCF